MEYIKAKAPHISLWDLVRRVGKTYGRIHYSVGLMRMGRHINACKGAYYCPETEQAKRNATIACDAVIRGMPGAEFKEKDGIVSIPFPIIGNPDRTLTYNLFGCRGGTSTKVGTDFFVADFDEVDDLKQKFVEDVGLLSAKDTNGLIGLSGTEQFNGVLEYFRDLVKKYVKVLDLMKRGKLIGEPPKVAGSFHHFYGNAITTGAYTVEQIEFFKATLSHEAYMKNLFNVNTRALNKYYYRHIFESEDYEDDHIISMNVDPNLPIYAFYDLGVGKKSDLMAYLLAQLDAAKAFVLYAKAIRNANLNKLATDLLGGTKDEPGNPFGVDGIVEHVLPHDCFAKNVGDITAGSLMIEDWEAKNIPGWVRGLTRPTDKQSDITIAESFLHKTYFNVAHAGVLVTALKMYSRKEVGKDSGVYSAEPAKTIHRDLADTFRCMAVDWKAEGGFGGRTDWKRTQNVLYPDQDLSRRMSNKAMGTKEWELSHGMIDGTHLMEQAIPGFTQHAGLNRR